MDLRIFNLVLMAKLWWHLLMRPEESLQNFLEPNIAPDLVPRMPNIGAL